MPALWSRLRTAKPFFLFAGPNVIESQQHCVGMARAIKRVCDDLRVPCVFKASFDKANRSSRDSFRGPGLEAGLRALQAVRDEVGLPVVTDIHEPAQAAAAAQVADVLQIPAFLCRQTDLLTAAAHTGRIVHIKKGQWCDASVMLAAADKVRHAGNERIVVCERGTAFGYDDLVVDPRNLVRLRAAGGLVTADVTHALQQPGRRVDAGGAISAGGLRDLIPAVARTAVAVGVDGLFLEVHNDPQASPCDAPTQWPLRHLRPLLEELVQIAEASRGREPHRELDLRPVALT
jgi:2-dehydro-3-deoxyphosphooctonate aldolase (KDO 8-P synthase)